MQELEPASELEQEKKPKKKSRFGVITSILVKGKKLLQATS